MTIALHHVSKSYRLPGRTHTVLRDLSLTIPPRTNIGLLGRNGAGKSTLLRLMGGIELPDTGRVVRSMRVSWPVGFSGFFQGAMSGITNVKFCARIYDRDPDTVLRDVADFAEIGDFMDAPVNTYSSGMRARLAFALSMAIDFDCLLIDEVTAVGDARFRAKCEAALLERRKSAGMVLVSHSLDQIARMCNRVVTLIPGAPAEISDDVKGAIDRHRQALLDTAHEQAEGTDGNLLLDADNPFSTHWNRENAPSVLPALAESTADRPAFEISGERTDAHQGIFQRIAGLREDTPYRISVLVRRDPQAAHCAGITLNIDGWAAAATVILRLDDGRTHVRGVAKLPGAECAADAVPHGDDWWQVSVAYRGPVGQAEQWSAVRLYASIASRENPTRPDLSATGRTIFARPRIEPVTAD